MQESKFISSQNAKFHLKVPASRLGIRLPLVSFLYLWRVKNEVLFTCVPALMLEQVGHRGPWAFFFFLTRGVCEGSVRTNERGSGQMWGFTDETMNNSGTKDESEMEVRKLSGMEGNDGWDAATSR